MNVSATWTMPPSHRFQPFQSDRPLRHHFTISQPFLLFSCWSRPSLGVLTIFSSSPANSAPTMQGNGGSHGLPSWTLCPYTPHARSIAGSFSNFIFATQLTGAITLSTSATGCSYTALTTFASLAWPLTPVLFAHVILQMATRPITSLCLSGNGSIFAIWTPTFTGRLNLLRYEAVNP